MKKRRAIGWGLWVLYAFSLFCSFHFDWVSQYRDFFAVYFLVASSVVWYLICKK